MLSDKRILLLIFITALILRLSLFLFIAPWEFITDQDLLNDPRSGVHILSLETGRDDVWYHNSALGILEGGIPDSSRGYGYPYIISVIYRILGADIWNVLLVQSFMDAVTVSVIFLIAYTAFKDLAVSVLASAFYLLDTTPAYYVLSIASETSFAMAFSIFFLFMILSFSKKSLRYAALAGLVLGICAHIRVIAMLYPLIALIPYAIKRERWRMGIAFALVFLLIVSPIFVKNYSESQTIAITSQSGSHLCHWVAAYAKSHVEGNERTQASRALCKVETRGGPFEISAIKGDRAIGYIRAHPVAFVTVQLHGMYDLFLADPISLTKSKYSYAFEKWDLDPANVYAFLRPTQSAYHVLVLALMVLGIMNRPRSMTLIFAATVLYFCLLPGPAGGLNHGRFRVPIQPFISILSAYGMVFATHALGKIYDVVKRRWILKK